MMSFNVFNHVSVCDPFPHRGELQDLGLQSEPRGHGGVLQDECWLETPSLGRDQHAPGLPFQGGITHQITEIILSLSGLSSS